MSPEYIILTTCMLIVHRTPVDSIGVLTFQVVTDTNALLFSYDRVHLWYSPVTKG